MRKPEFWNPDKDSWFYGYWCAGPESLPGDGLLCYLDLEGRSENEREFYLVEESKTREDALIKFIVANIDWAIQDIGG